MHIKSVVAGAAIALAATIGTAYAADQFATLDGVSVQPMNAVELDRIKGMVVTLTIPAAAPDNPTAFPDFGVIEAVVDLATVHKDPSISVPQ